MTWQGSLPYIQYGLFPLLLAWAAYVRFLRARIPKAVLGFALCGGLFSFAYSYVPWFGPARTAAMTTLAGDALTAKTRILRERVNANLAALGESGVRGVSRVVRNHDQARRLMESSGVHAAIWGNTRWVRVSFPESPPLALSEIKERHEFMGLGGLQLVTFVPSVGLSYEPRNETADFIAGILAGLVPGFSHAISADEFAQREVILRDTANLVSFWSGDSHRALAWWALGNLHAFYALQGDEIDRGELRCAVSAYKKARSFIRAQDKASRDLLIAIVNNLAVVRLTEHLFSAGKGTIARGRKRLLPALKLARKPPLYHLKHGPALTARHNWQLLKGYFPAGSHGKQRHKHPRKKLHKKP